MGDSETILDRRPGLRVPIESQLSRGRCDRGAQQSSFWNRQCAILCFAIFLLMGCAPSWEGSGSRLETQGTALYELPFAQEMPTGIQPGRYTVSVDVIYTATQEEATKRCNFGLPGGDSLACYLKTNNIIITPVPRNANDWTSMCYLGHEVTHATHGAWHQ